MKVDSLQFGSFEAGPEKIVEFPQGLPGFEQCRRFTFVHEEGREPLVFTMQALDDPAVALSVTDPARFGLHYELTLSDEETALLKLEAPEDAAVLVIVRRQEGTDGAAVGANLIAPLVVNVRQRRGLQQVLGRVGCDITLRGA